MMHTRIQRRLNNQMVLQHMEDEHIRRQAIREWEEEHRDASDEPEAYEPATEDWWLNNDLRAQLLDELPDHLKTNQEGCTP